MTFWLLALSAASDFEISRYNSECKQVDFKVGRVH